MVCSKGVPKLLKLCLEYIKAIGSLLEPIIFDVGGGDAHAALSSHDLHEWLHFSFFESNSKELCSNIKKLYWCGLKISPLSLLRI
jgi:hypothetical protein